MSKDSVNRLEKVLFSEKPQQQDDLDVFIDKITETMHSIGFVVEHVPEHIHPYGEILAPEEITALKYGIFHGICLINHVVNDWPDIDVADEGIHVVMSAMSQYAADVVDDEETVNRRWAEFLMGKLESIAEDGGPEDE